MSVTTVTTSIVWMRCPGSAEALRGAVTATGGTEVGGDADHLIAVYPSLGAALDAAVAVQQEAERRGPSEAAPPVRIGLSTGDVTVDAGTYGGEPMAEAEGLAVQAADSQIVTTAMVQLLARRGGHEFRSIGSFELADVSEVVDAFEVVWAPATLAPLVDLPARLSHVPSAAIVGRDAQRSRLEAARVDSAAHGLQLVFLAGEPGIGKTTLASDLARRAHEAGSTVLYGRCEEDIGVPYQPFVEALGDLVRPHPELLAGLDGRQVGSLSRLLPVVSRTTDPVDPSSADPDSERYLLFGAVVTLVTELASLAPVVLVLDDLHWADKPTVLMLGHLLTTLDDARVLVVATYRPNDLAADHPLRQVVLGTMEHDPRLTRIEIDGLDDDGVVALLESMAGHEMDDDGRTLARSVRLETGGNPFFCTEVVRHLADSDAIRQVDGRWVAAGDLSAIGLPESVREVVSQRVRLLGEPVLRLLSVASVLGRDFDVSMLTRAADASDTDVREAVARAVEADILADVDGAPGRCTFGHALFQHTLYGDLSASRRARLHRRIAELLEADCGDDPGDRVGELAHHWVAASRPDRPDTAIRYARQAGDQALRALAPDEAIRWYRQSLELIDADAAQDHDVRLDVLIGLGDAQRQAGDPDYRSTLLDAGDQAAALGDTSRLVAAALANQRGMVSSIGTVDPERIAMLEKALGGVGDDDSVPRAVLLAALTAELTFSQDRARLGEIADEAESIARRLGDESVLLRVLNVMFLARWVPDQFAENLARCAEVRALADRVDDPVERLRAATNRMQMMTSHADRAGMDEAMSAAEALAREIGQPYTTWQVRYLRCLLDLLSGDAEAGERLADEALTIGSASGQPDVFVIYGANLINVRFHQDRLADVLPLIEQSAIDNPGLPTFEAAWAMALCECGRFDEARPLLDAAASADFHHGAYDYVWLTTTTLWAETASWLGDADAAAVLFQRLAPFEAQGVTSGASFSGVVGMYAARLAVVLGRHADALGLFERADLRLAAIGSPFWQARNQIEWAETLLQTGSPESGVQAGRLLTSALTIATSNRCVGLTRRAGARLASLG